MKTAEAAATAAEEATAEAAAAEEAIAPASKANKRQMNAICTH